MVVAMDAGDNYDDIVNDDDYDVAVGDGDGGVGDSDGAVYAGDNGHGPPGNKTKVR